MGGASRTISIQCAIQIGIQLTKALQDMHTLGFVHRDIKPNNILTSYRVSNNKLEAIGDLEKNIYLIDFGLSKKFKNGQNTTN